MCGIIGYIGDTTAAPVIFESLKRLEYRGYDSYGFATLDKNEFFLKKGMGKISDAVFKSLSSELPGFMGVGHSRWATHGKVSAKNSHPHTDCKGKFLVVHNGIIENYQDLRKELKNKGHVFKSDTDTEIIPHMIEEFSNLGFEEAVKKAVKKIKGRYAIVAMSSDSDVMIGVRKGSPLIVGVNNKANRNKEYFLASDIPAFLKHTNNVMYLDDKEMVMIDSKKMDIRFHDLGRKKDIEKRIINIGWDSKQTEKDGFEHFMLKEIMEQKDTIRMAINQNMKDIDKIAGEINTAFGTFFTGCGTAGNVCLAGEYIFSKVAGKHINFIVSSEFPNYHHFLTDKTLLIAVSQSGETADLLEATESTKKKGVKIISLVNVMGSTLDRKSDHSFLINAGPEKAVASTKAATSQLALVTLLAYACAGKLNEGRHLLAETASKVNDMLNPRYEEHIRKLAEKIHDKENIYIIGRSLNYPMALESAIKIQEVSYIHAQGFAGGELKHGPLALIGKGTPCIALVAGDEVKDDIISNAMEIKSRGGYIIGVAPENNEVFDYWIRVPDVGNASPIVNIIPIQILAYHLAVLRGIDPDYPKNLAKSVTVK
jgi:glucosamine--fructose-6-phosphate aminotransferase (isomerizing)